MQNYSYTEVDSIQSVYIPLEKHKTPHILFPCSSYTAMKPQKENKLGISA